MTDVNDNVPEFELPDYLVYNIDEKISIGTSILKVKATDRDSGANAEIEYSVTDNHFTVDLSGVISNAKQLDADNNNAYYEFTVTANGKGEPSRSGVATARIYTKNKNVKDVNDNPPVFERSYYEVQINEEDDRLLPKRLFQVNLEYLNSSLLTTSTTSTASNTSIRLHSSFVCCHGLFTIFEIG